MTTFAEGTVKFCGIAIRNETSVAGSNMAYLLLMMPLWVKKDGQAELITISVPCESHQQTLAKLYLQAIEGDPLGSVS